MKFNDTNITSLNLVEFVDMSSKYFANGNKEFSFTSKRVDDILTATFVESGT
ncbi:MAG: hypothetical protein JXA96_02110 [Sedimentisphaerales bacterium]|nr:hypothetical protein [Sedimentisphaerales bacterium]